MDSLEPRPMRCPVDHNRLRGDRLQLSRTCIYNGPQDDGAGGHLELWTCQVCGSTISVLPPNPRSGCR